MSPRRRRPARSSPHRFEIETKPPERTDHEGARGELMFQQRVISEELPRPYRLAVLDDLRTACGSPIRRTACLEQRFVARSVAEFVGDRDVPPQRHARCA